MDIYFIEYRYVVPKWSNKNSDRASSPSKFLHAAVSRTGFNIIIFISFQVRYTVSTNSNSSFGSTFHSLQCYTNEQPTRPSFKCPSINFCFNGPPLSLSSCASLPSHEGLFAALGGNLLLYVTQWFQMAKTRRKLDLIPYLFPSKLKENTRFPFPVFACVSYSKFAKLLQA